MKAVCKKLFSLMLVAILLVSAVPFQASAEEVTETIAATEAVVATEAAVVAASEEEANEEISASEPEAYAGVELATDAVWVDFQLADNPELGINATYAVDVVKSKLTKKISSDDIPSASKALSVLKKAIGTNECYEFVRWYYEVDGVAYTFNSSVVLNEQNMVYVPRDTNNNGIDGWYLDVYAEFKKVPAKITLDAGKGTVNPETHKVMIGEAYNAYGKLPTPTRKGYTFLGWENIDGVLITEENAGEVIVNNLGKLTAKWSGALHRVTFLKHNGTAWEVASEKFALADVKNGAVLKTDYSNFPNTTEINELFKLKDWTIEGWQYSVDANKDGDIDENATWKTFTAGKTEVTNTIFVRPVYTKSITLYARDSGNTSRKLSVTLGMPFPALPHPGVREGSAFIGWISEDAEIDEDNLVSLKEDLSNTSKHPIVDNAEITALYAAWDHATTIILNIHTNGNVKEPTKVVKYYDVPTSGFYMSTIDLASIYTSYGKYDDKGDEQYGWYNEAQWKNYGLDRYKDETTEYIDGTTLTDGATHEYYIMLIDNGNNASSSGTNGTAGSNSYNDNKSTQDSSNPTTGDDIFVAVTIMAISACAVLVIFMNKKRLFK